MPWLFQLLDFIFKESMAITIDSCENESFHKHTSYSGAKALDGDVCLWGKNKSIINHFIDGIKLPQDDY